MLALVAGFAVPNLFFVNTLGPAVRATVINLAGRGVNAGAHPATSPWSTLGPWHLLIVAAVVGLALSAWRRDFAATLWASGALSMGLLAHLR